jgi:preprotein translocase subunit SecG
MYVIFGILAIVAAVLLILVVVIQNSKGGGLSNALGASNISNMIGSRRAAQDIEKVTWYLIAAVMVLSFFANVTIPTNAGSTTKSFSNMMGAPEGDASAADAPAKVGEDGAEE